MRLGKFGIFGNEHIHKKDIFNKNMFMNIFILINELENLSNLVNWQIEEKVQKQNYMSSFQKN